MLFKKKNYEKDALLLYRGSRSGILSTISKKYEGYPFGSFVTFVSCANRSLIIYTSNIAQHTINLKNNSKACLTLSELDTDYDEQNSSRLTLMGDLKEIPDAKINLTKERFFKFLPKSKNYSSMHDFKFYKLEISKIRWIGGFGDIAWLNSKNWDDQEPEWLEDEKMIVDHMNDDHSNVIKSVLNAIHKIKDEDAKMFSLCIDGYYILSNEKIYFIQFEKPVFSSLDYRKCLVKQAKKYRSYEF
tara:strand:+ start:2430 stop:3161 length:732 start_codon:yes stop_codon:yes gene_type:complete